MSEIIKMPKLGLSMQKGTVEKWLYHEGDQIKKGDIIAEISTEKITNEIESPIDGILLKIYVQEGETVPILTPLGVVGKMGEEIDINKEKDKSDKEEKSKVKDILEIKEEDKNSKSRFKQTGQIEASPVAIKYAQRANIEISKVKGTGPGGRIMKKDIVKYLKSNDFKQESTIKQFEDKFDKNINERIPYRGMRKIIGDRLSQSKFTFPHIYLTISVDMTKTQELIEIFREKTQVGISINDFIVLIVAKVLTEQPNINSSLINEEIILRKGVHIGVAVALEEGLIVPVLRNADKKNLITISKEIKNLVKSAREGKLMPDDYKGGTFTISNLGMYGIEQFTAIINPPEAAILSIGKITKKPIVIDNKNEKIKVRSIMKMTVSVDHRIIDGTMAAKFLNQLKYYLEFPEALIFK